MNWGVIFIPIGVAVFLLSLVMQFRKGARKTSGSDPCGGREANSGRHFAPDLNRMKVEPVIDQESVNSKIETVRNAIVSDWAELATKGLTYEQRKEIRTRLQTHVKTLSQLKQRRQQAVRNIGADAVKNALPPRTPAG